jgi:hypothetical protein
MYKRGTRYNLAPAGRIGHFELVTPGHLLNSFETSLYSPAYPIQQVNYPEVNVNRKQLKYNNFGIGAVMPL